MHPSVVLPIIYTLKGSRPKGSDKEMDKYKDDSGQFGEGSAEDEKNSLEWFGRNKGENRYPRRGRFSASIEEMHVLKTILR